MRALGKEEGRALAVRESDEAPAVIELIAAEGAGDSLALLVSQGDEEDKFIRVLVGVAGGGLADLQRARGDTGVNIGIGDVEGVGRGLARAHDIEGGLVGGLGSDIAANVGIHGETMIRGDQAVTGGGVLQVAAGVEVEDGGLRRVVRTVQMQLGAGTLC